MRRPHLKLSGFKICLFVTFLICGVYALDPWMKVLYPIELKALDARFKVRGMRDPGPEIAIIAIDDKSIEKIGRWPWSRSVFARMVDILSKGEAKVIGFDILFLLPEEQPEYSKIRQLMDRYRNLDLAKVSPQGPRFYGEMTNALKQADHDSKFAQSIEKSGRVVLALLLHPGRQKKKEPSKPQELNNYDLYKGVYSSVGKIEQGFHVTTVQAREIFPPLKPFMAAARGLGYANSFPDEDGSLRRETLAIEYAGEYFLPLSVSMLAAYLDLTPQQIRINPGDSLELGSLVADTDESNRFLINYYGPAGAYPYYSFNEVLEGKVSPSIFKDKIVLIGWKAAGIGDFWVTPTSPALPGVEKQATIISNILHQDFIIRNKYLVIWDLALILITGLTLGLLIPKLSPLGASSFSLLLCVLLAAFIQYTFSHAKLWIYAVYPFLTIGLAYSCTIIFRLLTEEREKRKIKNTFQFYVTPSVVNEMLKNPEKLKLGGDRKELTVLFSDIRGFTTISEGLDPQGLVHLLNEYLTKMTDVVFKYDGTLDKYIGDAIMAIYGAPLYDDDHPVKACYSALDMMEELRELRKKWEARGMPLIDIGIGINTGPMVAGNMGSQTRFDYTVMGDSVNLGSRLEGSNREYGTHIVISEYTHHYVSDLFVSRQLDFVRVKGKRLPIKIFELVGRKEAFEGDLERARIFEEGLGLYLNRRWRQAIQAFEAVLGIEPTDTPSKIYIQRCRDYMKSPPPEDWDGVYTMPKK